MGSAPEQQQAPKDKPSVVEAGYNAFLPGVSCTAEECVAKERLFTNIGLNLNEGRLRVFYTGVNDLWGTSTHFGLQLIKAGSNRLPHLQGLVELRTTEDGLLSSRYGILNDTFPKLFGLDYGYAFLVADGKTIGAYALVGKEWKKFRGSSLEFVVDLTKPLKQNGEFIAYGEAYWFVGTLLSNAKVAVQPYLAVETTELPRPARALLFGLRADFSPK